LEGRERGAVAPVWCFPGLIVRWTGLPKTGFGFAASSLRGTGLLWSRALFLAAAPCQRLEKATYTYYYGAGNWVTQKKMQTIKILSWNINGRGNTPHFGGHSGSERRGIQTGRLLTSFELSFQL
jgi:hypothetical protein